MNKLYQLKTRPRCRAEAIVKGKYYRISVLTPSLLRLEYSENGNFEDRATQVVIDREFPVPEYQVTKKKNELIIETEDLTVFYNEEPFSPSGLSIQMRFGMTWRFGDEPRDLGGTARTLDRANGAVPLGHGLLSRWGYAVLDDSRSMVLTEENWVEARSGGVTDIYFFGYGHAYQRCIDDFYHLCGKTPLLPRWALGNWWCRYHKYTEPEYKNLMERFEREHIPFSVAVIDMDWHLVDDVDPKYGRGWTGYTWNKNFFPDPPKFMKWLHEHGLKVTLNLHPADGVRAYEDPYPAIAEEMGVDREKEEPVRFDVTDPHFMEAYFKYLHHPMEQDGVDFWWIDWQQGNVSKIPGLDPLWMLNHFHYLDSRWKGTRPITFSRFSGVGSHRYPIGFSGDTVMTWESLDFQPYFTSTASNVGYGWWSHDIGGNMGGYKDDELATRWIQFGVFSPIMRLHSSANPFNSKEPWNFNPVAEDIMKRYLLLRHRLVPYLYTMNRLASRGGKPLMRPMYWLEPEREEVYHVPNEYYFGSELIAAPVTKPEDRSICMAETKGWLPEGLWFDIFTGSVYHGNRMHTFWRYLETLPVLAKAGAIVPLADLSEYTNSTQNPSALEISVFPGADGDFTLWEDGGDSPDDSDANWAATKMSLKWSEKPKFFIEAASGNLSVIPAKRRFTVRFRSIEETAVSVFKNGNKTEAKCRYDKTLHTLSVSLPEISVGSSLSFEFEDGVAVAKTDRAAETFRLLDRAQMSFNLKEQIQNAVEKYGTEALGALDAMNLERPLYSAISEILLS